MKINTIINLQNTSGNHYKEYTLGVVDRENGVFELYALYGKIGSTQTLIKKYASKVLNSVNWEVTKLKDEKMKKGYRLIQVTPTRLRQFTQEMTSVVKDTFTVHPSPTDIDHLLADMEVK